MRDGTQAAQREPIIKIENVTKVYQMGAVEVAALRGDVPSRIDRCLTC